MKIQKSADRSRRRIAAETEVAPEATELVLEADDVADLLTEVTGEDVAVDVTDDSLEFTVGEEVYTVEPDEGEEVELMETTTRKLRTKKSVAASRKVNDRINRRPAAASRKVIRK